MIEAKDVWGEALVIALKIVGALAFFLSLRWLVNIFRGKDRRLDKNEFKELVALIFFVCAAGWIIYKEGERTDLTHEVYGPSYLAIVFGSLLVVLHLRDAMDKILAIVQALVMLRSGGGISQTTTETTNIKEETKVQTG